MDAAWSLGAIEPDKQAITLATFRVVWPRAGRLSPLIPASPPAEQATVWVRTRQAGSQNDADLRCSRGSLEVAFPPELLTEEPSIMEDVGSSLLERDWPAVCLLLASARPALHHFPTRPTVCFLGFCSQ